MLRKVVLPALMLAAAPALARAQSLSDQLTQLFTFGTCGQPLCLDVPGAHGSHFIGSLTAGNQTVIAFVTEAIGKTSSNLPISSTSAGASYSIVNGLPVRTSTSAGPIFTERSRTLGRGRFFLGANVTTISYTSLNGVPADKLSFNFAHEDVAPAGLGDPSFENDVISMNLGLNVDQLVATLVATLGVTDFLDIGVAAPFIRVSMQGSSVAQINPFGSPTPHHFAGTDTDPVLSASQSVNGTASGIGDVVGRIKVNLGQGTKVGAALLGEVRFPTGDEANLLGSGHTSVRGLGIFSMQFGNFAARFNGGYVVRTGDLQNDGVLASLGFDQLMTTWATVAFDILGEWQVGDNRIALPGPIHYTLPFDRTIPATNIPVRTENRLDASLGFKFNVRGGTMLVVNGIVPVRRTSLQPDFLFTTGVEFTF